MINFYFEDIDEITLSNSVLSSWISKVIDTNDKSIGDISYIFCSDKYILQVNKDYLNHDYYTDIITFNYNEGSIISGDLFISLDTVKSNSQLFNTPFTKELNRVIIHGILHLIGYDDQSDEDQLEMTKQENLSLELLKTIS
ncbi:rRNA maturation RNase YbeY [Saccharicrinis aurantiacus]|uniref:rRNA maturation RNase YbeY n=1 Tax=Saccharicrinis aurantiacus TaxID=1849719 RepID=UPI002491F9A4|nr:rRNA maturation RNase YbeY [Saccharicrinis aurantiacus]